MLKDAPILLLDEATSALDSEVEAAIAENLYRLMEGKTVIAVAHRLSTIAALDRLVVLDKGRILEEGSHAELIERGGLYADLWRRQVGGFLDAGDDGTLAGRARRACGRMIDGLLRRFERVIDPYGDVEPDGRSRAASARCRRCRPRPTASSGISRARRAGRFWRFSSPAA